MKATLILALMVAIVPLDRHRFHKESVDAARVRYGTIANTIRAETEDRDLVFYLLTVGRHESGFNHKVHSGALKGDRDRSWGLYQTMCGVLASCKVPRTDYTAGELVGLSYLNTRFATSAGAIHLQFHIARCGGNPYCVMRNYLGAPPSSLSTELQKRVNARVSTFYRLKRIAKKEEDQHAQP